MDRASGSPPASPPAHAGGFSAFCSAISDTLSGMATTSRSRRKQEDEKKNKKKQSPVDDRPVVPAPSEAMLNNLRTAFGLLDRDSDGHVTPAELQFMLRNLGIQVSDDLIAELIKDASKTESADTSEFSVECGDVILVATDGVFDNVPEPVLVAEMRRAQDLAGNTEKLQAVANSIAWMARNLSFDGCYMSPFAKSARQNGIDAIGGKPDDITVLLAIVAL